jgi:hypothetical protein
MSTKNDGGPAFGQVVALRCVRVEMNGDTDWEPEAMTIGGLSTRDYFAAKAMAGMLAYPGCESRGSHHNNNTPDGVAAMAYKYADAMLKARGE